MCHKQSLTELPQVHEARGSDPQRSVDSGLALYLDPIFCRTIIQMLHTHSSPQAKTYQTAFFWGTFTVPGTPKERQEYLANLAINL
jgi:hypothetical protein